VAEVLLFHHAQGLTPGCLAFADDLRAAGHVVHTPDLFDGRTFAELEDGMALVGELGFDTIVERGRQAAEGLPEALVYAGFSLGAMPAETLAATRPGARAALLFHAAIPLSYVGPWPEGVPLQIHTMEDDELGDVAEARELAAAVPGAELFLYPGDRHLFADRSLPDYDEGAARLLLERALAFLGRLS
jgi:dienelactone hydrolase